jgi:hypothetical protein
METKMTKKNLLLGTSINFTQENLKNFIISFREFNQVDDCVLFIDEVNKEISDEFFKKYNITTYSFTSYKFIDTPIHNARYVNYLDFLSNNTQYDHIFLADTKDVVFQKNIFENLPEEYLYLFQEESAFKVKDDPTYNAFWIYSAYGPEVLQNFLEQNVICSGTILGSYNEIMSLLKAINQEFLKIKQNSKEVFHHTILDQAVVNYLGRTMNNPNLRIKSNGDIIATVGVTLDWKHSTDQVLINGPHLLLNHMEPAAIHQYDRNETLKNTYTARFNY